VNNKKDHEFWWNDTDGEEPNYSEEKPFVLPLCPPNIPHGLSWDEIGFPL